MRFLILTMLTIPVFEQVSQEERLLNSYNQKSKEELRLFFKNWSTEIPSITDEELNTLNDTLRQTYNVFKTFYQPDDNYKAGESVWVKGVYKRSEYLIVQSEIEIRFAKTLNKDSVIHNNIKAIYGTDTARQNQLIEKATGKYKKSTIRLFSYRTQGELVHTISNFRPQIENAVFLTEEYDSLLKKFVGYNPYKLENGEFNGSEKVEDEREKRIDFINQVATIVRGTLFYVAIQSV